MDLSFRGEIAFLALALIAWFAMVVPRYALSLQLRGILETKTKAEKLSSWSGRVFEVHCLVFAALTGAATGLFTDELNLMWVLAGSLVGMLIIGFVSTLAAHGADVSDEVLGRPTSVVIFMFAGSTLFWAAAALVRWSVFEDSRPDFDRGLEYVSVAGVTLSVLSTAWTLWDKVTRKS